MLAVALAVVPLEVPVTRFPVTEGFWDCSDVGGSAGGGAAGGTGDCQVAVGRGGSAGGGGLGAVGRGGSTAVPGGTTAGASEACSSSLGVVSPSIPFPLACAVPFGS